MKFSKKMILNDIWFDIGIFYVVLGICTPFMAMSAFSTNGVIDFSKDGLKFGFFMLAAAAHIYVGISLLMSYRRKRESMLNQS